METKNLCPNCGVAIKEDMDFCGECGACLTKSCPGCNATISWQLKHCPRCGVNIGEKLASIEAEKERKKQQKEKKQKEREEKRIRRISWWRKHRWQISVSILVVAAGLATMSYLKSVADAYLLAENMTFVSIPGGSFSMGSPPSESGSSLSERPAHRVTIQPFEMMTTEVTQGMWEEVMGTTIQDLQSLSEDDYGLFRTGLLGTGPDYPMYFVSWNDCQEFVSAMNDLYPSYTYRLPSEAEWEYACRAGTITRYYWGDTMNGSYCWYDNNSNGTTHPVARKLPNAWGLFDMNGNVWEWCADWHHESYLGAPTDGSPWVSPSGSYRVGRGGAWFSHASQCRSSSRIVGRPAFWFNNLGFRLVRSVR